MFYILAILCAAVPFAFGVIRAVQTGSDFRYLWMALASYIGAGAVMLFLRARDRNRNVLLGQSTVAFVVATLLAAITGYLLGARAAAGIWIVSAAFGFCCASSAALLARSRVRTARPEATS